MLEVRIRFDFDGEVYLIPTGHVKIFDSICKSLDGLEYDDDIKSFEEFEEKFKKFRSGDIYETELFIKDKEN